MQNQFITLLLKWFHVNKRDLPWRHNRSFYRVWIAEVMLQQTQVRTVIPYYLRFMKNYPNIESFALADQQDLLKSWEGLGYYNRIKNAQKAAKIIVNDLNRNTPKNYDDLIKLPGFGPYTTAAILSFAYKQKHAVVDGNVIRVIARVFAMKQDFRLAKNKQFIQKLVDQLIPSDHPDQFNEALMELGALICRPKNPNCEICPVKTECLAYQQNSVSRLPKLSKRKPVPIKRFYSVLIHSKNKYFVRQREKNKMLGGMWEFPAYPFKSIKQMTSEIKQTFNIHSSIRQLGKVQHSYSHFKLELIVAAFELDEIESIENGEWLSLTEYEKRPSHGANQKVYQMLKQSMH